MDKDRHRLSVVVPVYNGVGMVERCLAAIAESEPLPGGLEVIVVDDGSTDGTGEVVGPLVDRVIRLEDGPAGPGRARNAGVRASRGEFVAFVDADVLVHADALGRCLAAFDGRDELGAVFGAYDDHPEGSGLASRYRNLLHRYVHIQGAGAADTFWAGLGAVRREAFLAVGGFDAQRFRRPQIEDIELGYRLNDAGWTILLDPEIQGTHLKRWSLRDIVRTDVRDRGIPWMRLLLERGEAGLGDTLNVKRSEKAKTAVAMLILPLLLATPFLGWWTGVPAGLLAGGLVVWNLPFYRWLSRAGGLSLTVGAVPLHLLYYVLNGFSAAAGWVLYRAGRRTTAPAGVEPVPEDTDAGAPAASPGKAGS